MFRSLIGAIGDSPVIMPWWVRLTEVAENC